MYESARISNAAANIGNRCGAIVKAVILGMVGKILLVAHIVPVGITQLKAGIVRFCKARGDLGRRLIDNYRGIRRQETNAKILLQKIIYTVHGAAIAAARDIQSAAILKHGVAVQLDLCACFGHGGRIAVSHADHDLVLGGFFFDAIAGRLFEILHQLVCAATYASSAAILHDQGKGGNIHAADGKGVKRNAVVGLGFRLGFGFTFRLGLGSIRNFRDAFGVTFGDSLGYGIGAFLLTALGIASRKRKHHACCQAAKQRAHPYVCVFHDQFSFNFGSEYQPNIKESTSAREAKVISGRFAGSAASTSACCVSPVSTSTAVTPCKRPSAISV